MKIIVAGEWTADFYEKAIASAFEQLGHEVIPFRISGYFRNTPGDMQSSNLGVLSRILYKAQYKYIFGPSVYFLNRDFIQLIKVSKADLVFIYRGNYFYPATIRTIRQTTGSKVVVYNNDDPFGKAHPVYLWRFFIKALPFYHHIFFFRKKNGIDYAKIKIHNTSLLLAYYRKEINYPINDINDQRYINDVSFIGHYEDDGRDEYLKYLLDHGVALNVYGTLWEKSKYYHQFSERMKGPIKALREDYNLCINSNKIALVFFSSLNNDTYTIRSFEIPAAGTFMLSVYTDDMNDFFKEGLETEYFRNKEELLSKVKYYLIHEKERECIAQAGYERLLAGGHEVLDRAKQVLDTYERLK